MDTKLNIEAKPNSSNQAHNDIPHVYIDDFLVSLKYYVDEQEVHLQIISPEVCVRCEGKPCLHFCTVGAYQEYASGHIQIAYQSCIECGSCRVMCPFSNVRWKYPRGGYAVAYKFR